VECQFLEVALKGGRGGGGAAAIRLGGGRRGGGVAAAGGDATRDHFEFTDGEFAQSGGHLLFSRKVNGFGAGPGPARGKVVFVEKSNAPRYSARNTSTILHAYKWHSNFVVEVVVVLPSGEVVVVVVVV